MRAVRRLISLGLRDSLNGRNLVALEAPERESSTGRSNGHLPPKRDAEPSCRGGVSVGGPPYGCLLPYSCAVKKLRRGAYDRSADAAYFNISPRINAGEAVRQDVHEIDGRGEVILDFDEDGKLLGVEILGAKSLLRPSTLKQAKRIG